MHMYPHYRYLGPNLCMNFIRWEKHEKCLIRNSRAGQPHTL